MSSYIGTAPATRDPEVSNDSVGTSKIQDDAVTAAKIANNAVGASEIAADAVGASEIAADAVGASELADNSVASANIVDGSIVNADINASAAIAKSKLAALDIVNADVNASAAIAKSKLASLAIVNADVNAGAAIDATKIADGSVTSAEFQYLGSVTSDIQTQINAKGVGDAVLASDQNWSGSQRSPLVTDNDGSFDLNGGNNFFCTPSAAVTLTFTNHVSGQSGYILFDNAGGHTISLHANTKGDANLASTLSTAGTYLVSYLDNGTNAYLTTSAVFA